MTATLTSSLAAWIANDAGYGHVTKGYESTYTYLGSGYITYPAGSVDKVGDTWGTWHGSYKGEVVNVPGGVNVTLNMTGVQGFGFWVEPDQFSTEKIKILLTDGQTVTRTVNGDGGAKFFGYYGDSGGSIAQVTISDTAGDDFAFGNFYYLDSSSAADASHGGGQAGASLVHAAAGFAPSPVGHVASLPAGHGGNSGMALAGVSRGMHALA